MFAMIESDFRLFLRWVIRELRVTIGEGFEGLLMARLTSIACDRLEVMMGALVFAVAGAAGEVLQRVGFG